MARLLPILVAADCVCVFFFNLLLVLSDLRVLAGSYLVLSGPAKDLSSVRICRFSLRFTLCCYTCFRLALEVCRFNSVNRDRLHLAYYQDFHDSAIPNDDLVWSLIRGGQAVLLRFVTKIHASMF